VDDFLGFSRWPKRRSKLRAQAVAPAPEPRIGRARLRIKPAIGIEPMISRLPREYCFRRSPAGEKGACEIRTHVLQFRRLPLLIPLS
jgi:hypothetical protein